MKAIGIDVGGTNLKAAIVDKESGIVEQLSIPSEATLGPDHLLDRIAETASTLAQKADVIGIGLGIPGMVSKDQTTVSHPPNLTGWAVVNVVEEISNRVNIPCKIENDANIAALGSLYFGAGRKFDDFILITLGTGVGGGVILERKIFKGPQGMAGELGHVIIDYHGPLSNSVTRGTIEAYLGQRFLSRYASDLISQHQDNPLFKKFNGKFEQLEPKHLSDAAKSGNELALEILEKGGQKLGYAIINFTHMFDIRKYIISGGVSKAGNFLLEPAKETALKHMMKPYREGFEILQEDLGNDIALLGAASLAFDSFS